MSSFSFETLHPRVRSAPCPSRLCLHRRGSPQTRGRWEPPPPIQPHGRPCAVGPRAFCRIRCTICQDGQPDAPRTSPPTREAALPASLVPCPRSGPAAIHAPTPRRHQPRHRRVTSQGMREGPAPSRGPGPVTLSTGSPISVRGASPLRGRRRRRLAGRRARWQLRCLRQCWQACCLQCSCRPWAAPAQESAGTARQ